MKRWDRVAIVSALIGIVIAVFVWKFYFTHMTLPTPGTEHMTTQGSSKLPRLVDLGSTTCIPCKMMAPILDELAKGCAGRMQVEFIDATVNPDAAKPYAIKLIPTQVFFDASGKELWRHEGFFSKEDILGKWKELGVDLVAPASAPATVPESATTAPTVKSGST